MPSFLNSLFEEKFRLIELIERAERKSIPDNRFILDCRYKILKINREIDAEETRLLLKLENDSIVDYYKNC